MVPLTMFPSRYFRKESFSFSTASATTSGGRDLCDDGGRDGVTTREAVTLHGRRSADRVKLSWNTTAENTMERSLLYEVQMSHTINIASYTLYVHILGFSEVIFI